MKRFKELAVVSMLGLFFLLAYIPENHAQIGNTDLSSIKVDELTDDQIQALINKASLSGLSEVQLEATAAAQGMPAAEIYKLKNRIAEIKSSSSLQQDNSTTVVEDNSTLVIVNDNAPVTTNASIYGFTLFSSKTLSFEPSTNIATPLNYQLGPGDKLAIDIWGASQQSYTPKISAEGNITISGVGPLYISGMTIEEATAKIKYALGTIYSGLYSGNTFIKVSLSTIRSIKVNIVGEAAVPGTYTLSSLSTVFNAMYMAGGPSENGSLRDVKIIRDNKVVAELDFYEFLSKGILPGNMRLQDEDIVFISSYKTRVEVEGKVKVPGIFDVKSTETLNDLISFAGDFTGAAYTERLKVIRKTGTQFKILDIPKEEQDSFKLVNGDKVIVGEILDKYENKVEIEGSVWRPGAFAIDSGKTSLQDLILKAEGLKGDAFLKRVLVYRLLDDLSTEVIPLDITDISKAGDFILQKDDKVKISSIFDLQEEYNFTISGEVKNPGSFTYTENTSVEDLIIRAGGLLESATSARIDIARRIADHTSLSPSTKIAEIFQFSIDSDLALSDSASKFILEPFDQVFIRKSPAYSKQELVTINGEVLLPGSYSLSDKGERISDLLARCGSITSEAYLNGARLIRQLSYDKKMQLKDIEKLKVQINDSIDVSSNLRSNSTIAINLEKILKKPGSRYDLFLKEGDELYIPKLPQTVGLSGALLYPVVAPFVKGYSVRKYIANSGGFSEDAKRSKIYVVNFNGSVKRTHKILFFNNYPKIEAGAEIIVPEKKKRDGLDKTDAVGFAASISSFALMVVYLINALK